MPPQGLWAAFVVLALGTVALSRRPKHSALKPKHSAKKLRLFLDSRNAGDAFKHRRAELQLLQPSRGVSDQAVVESFVNSVTPSSEESFVLDFLEHAELAYLFEGKILFVHGAVTQHNLLKMPPSFSASPGTVAEWVDWLNKWAKAELKDYKRTPSSGGADLRRYSSDPRGVIYATNLKQGNPVTQSEAVQNKLSDSGVSTVVCGHSPFGDCVTVIGEGSVRVVTADTSYSDNSASDKRGRAVNEVSCSHCCPTLSFLADPLVLQVVIWEDGRMEVHGTLANGELYHYKLAAPGQKSTEDEDPFVGRRLDDGFWVRTPLRGGGTYLLSKGQDFKVHAREETKESLTKELDYLLPKEESLAKTLGRKMVGFFTDVEGNLEYLQRYVEQSRVLQWKDKAKRDALTLQSDEAHFVFGGDSQDKGPGDIRCAKLLTALKKEFPERVHLIMGNRDVNKLGLLFSLMY